MSSNLIGSTKAAVAHQVEQQTENLCVAGSSPARGTNLQGDDHGNCCCVGYLCYNVFFYKETLT